MVSLTTATLTRSQELFVLYSKKAAFTLEEYADTGAVYKRVAAALEDSKESGSSDVSEVDVKFLISAINICAQRCAVEVQNYRPISELLETLAKTLTPTQSEEEDKGEKFEETKTDL